MAADLKHKVPADLNLKHSESNTTNSGDPSEVPASVTPSSSASTLPDGPAPTANFPGKARHCNDKYLTAVGDWGDKHYVVAWHATGHQVRLILIPCVRH